MKRITSAKHAKSLICMLLALVLVFGMCLPTASAYNAGTRAVDHRSYADAIAEAPAASPAGSQTIPANVFAGNHNGIHGVGDTLRYENENNNSPAMADAIYNDYTVSGYLTYQDVDFYGFNVTSTSVIEVIAVSGEDGTTFGLFDSYEDIIAAASFQGYSSSGDASWGMRITLQPGTYYLCFLNLDDYTDDYMFYFTITRSSSHQHSYTQTVHNPTCTADGYVLYTCSCGASYTESIPATGHRWNVATCTTAKTCATCGATEGSPLGHTADEGVVTVAPGCDTTGIRVHTCTVCHSTYNVVLPALGHDYVKNVCQVCGYILTFTDVPKDSWYTDPVSWAVSEGITSGIGGTLFGPEQVCNRAQVVTFLWRTAGSPEPTSSRNPFQDVNESDYFYEPVLWAVEKGITSGLSATTFGPAENCNRAQVVTFLYRSQGSPVVTSTVNPFYDVVPSDFYGPAVLWAVKNGITSGLSATEFGINSTCIRAQVVTFLYRTVNQKETPSSSITVAALETAYGSEVWAEVAAAFTAKTGIQVELVVDRNLEDVVTGPMQRAEFPDVIHLPTGRPAGLTEEMARVNAMHPLTNALNMTIPGESVTPADKIIPGFTDNRIVAPYGDGVTYMAPMFYSPCGLFYNANLFEEKGWNVPTTWSQMWVLGDLAAAEGISLFTYPTAGYYDSFMFALMNAIGGNEFFDSITTYEEGAWDSLNGRTLLSIMDKLTDYTHPNTVVQANNQDFYKNQQMVMDGRALFMPNGTWIVGEMADYASVIQDFEWGMTAIPSAGEAPAAYSWFEQTWIPASAENIDGAELFVAFLYSDVAADIFASAGAMQPILGLSDNLEGDEALFYSIYDNGASAAVGGFAPFVDIPGVDISSTFFAPIDNLTDGTMTIEEYADLVKTNSALMRENILPY